MDLLDKVEYEPKGYFIDPTGKTHSLAGLMDISPLVENRDSFSFSFRWWNYDGLDVVYDISKGKMQAEEQANRDIANLRKELSYQVLKGFGYPTFQQ